MSSIPYEVSEAEPQESKEIITVIDRVYEHITNKGVISLDELANNLGIRREHAEKITEMLEITKLITVKHSLMPSGDTWVLVSGTEQKQKRTGNGDRTKYLKRIITDDVARMENALASMEHHLSMWSSESEEELSKEGDFGDSLLKTNNESMKIEKNLEDSRSRISSRFSILKKRLSDMRVNINKTPEGNGKSHFSFF
ncbi:MAG: hypothetical protein ABIG39_05485, partial [Candidatus Micrarchaeota archaeon]